MANAVIETLLTRRSVRAFTDRPISREDLETIAQTAIYAPSGMGRQTWQFTVVADTAKIQKLAAVIERELGREGYNMYCPTAIIIPSNEKETPYGREDNACALENIFLAAHSLGIGSVWINQLNQISERPAVRALLKEFGVPDSHVVYGIAALGYAKDPAVKEVHKIGKIHFAE